MICIVYYCFITVLLQFYQKHLYIGLGGLNKIIDIQSNETSRLT